MVNYFSYFSNTVNGEYKIADMYYSSSLVLTLFMSPGYLKVIELGNTTIPSKLMNSMYPSNQSKEARCVMLKGEKEK